MRHLFLSEHVRDDHAFKSDDPLLLAHASQQVITLLSPFLETLSYIVPTIRDKAHFNHIFATPFPRLRELTFKGRYIQFPIPLPSLERLHLHLQYPYRLLCNLDQRCPRLTHLKITGLSYDGELIEIGLKRNLGILTDPREIRRAENVAPLCLPSLHFLILQRIRIQGGYCATGIERLRELWERLAELAKTGLCPMTFVVEEPVSAMRYRGQTYEDWLDRIEGREGCWKLGAGSEKSE